MDSFLALLQPLAGRPCRAAEQLCPAGPGETCAQLELWVGCCERDTVKDLFILPVPLVPLCFWLIEFILAGPWISSLSQKSVSDVKEQLAVTSFETDGFISWKFLSTAKVKKKHKNWGKDLVLLQLCRASLRCGWFQFVRLSVRH